MKIPDTGKSLFWKVYLHREIPTETPRKSLRIPQCCNIQMRTDFLIELTKDLLLFLCKMQLEINTKMVYIRLSVMYNNTGVTNIVTCVECRGGSRMQTEEEFSVSNIVAGGQLRNLTCQHGKNRTFTQIVHLCEMTWVRTEGYYWVVSKDSPSHFLLLLLFS